MLDLLNQQQLRKTINYMPYKTGPVAKPGLRRVESDGEHIAVETYSIPKRNLDNLSNLFRTIRYWIGRIEIR